MPINSKFLADFAEHGIYHVYNRTNNNEPLFLKDNNRLFFLEKYIYYLSPFLETFAWSLLSNHFHFQVQVREEELIQGYLKHKHELSRHTKDLLTMTESAYLANAVDISVLIEKEFSRFFQCYSASFNNYYSRKGNLFYKPFKRTAIATDEIFIKTMLYIHLNPVKHGIIQNINEYSWTSYHDILNPMISSEVRNEIFEYFGSKDRFFQLHENFASSFHLRLPTF